MNKPAKIEVPTGLDLLRQPFPAHQINKLPKPSPAQTKAVKEDYRKGIRCQECGQWHHPEVIHLDYVGHAALTDRLLEADPHWNWEPQARNEYGAPMLDQNGGLWINLTVCGVTRPGYGDAQGKTGGNAVKEAIGDALRNAAMRFGAALDLWHKGELHIETADEGHSQGDQGAVSPPAKQPAHSALKKKVRELVHEIHGIGDWETWVPFRETDNYQSVTAECEEKLPGWWEGWPEQPDGFVPLKNLIEQKEREFAESKSRLATA